MVLYSKLSYYRMHLLPNALEHFRDTGSVHVWTELCAFVLEMCGVIINISIVLCTSVMFQLLRTLPMSEWLANRQCTVLLAQENFLFGWQLRRPLRTFLWDISYGQGTSAGIVSWPVKLFIILNERQFPALTDKKNRVRRISRVELMRAS